MVLGGIRTPVICMAARNAADWATQALGSCGLLQVFNPLSHAATTGVWLAVVRIAYTRCYTRRSWEQTLRTRN